MLSEALQQAKAWAALAELAPSLRERELRVLVALTNKFAATTHQSGRASISQIAEWTGLSTSNVRLALADLGKRKAIATRAGTATEPAGHILTFTRATQINTAKGVPGVGTPYAYSRHTPNTKH